MSVFKTKNDFHVSQDTLQANELKIAHTTAFVYSLYSGMATTPELNYISHKEGLRYKILPAFTLKTVIYETKGFSTLEKKIKPNANIGLLRRMNRMIWVDLGALARETILWKRSRRVAQLRACTISTEIIITRARKQQQLLCSSVLHLSECLYIAKIRASSTILIVFCFIINWKHIDYINKRMQKSILEDAPQFFDETFLQKDGKICD